MNKAIDAKDKSLKMLLNNVQYSIDYYQRDYNWKTKNVEELVNDLTSKFLDSYRPEHVRSDVADYPSYFLGSVVLSKKQSETYIVDGQQRLTTLTLLLIYLRNLQRQLDLEAEPSLDSLVESTQYGRKNWNLNIEERNSTINELYSGVIRNESIAEATASALKERYFDIEECFPEQLKNHSLPFFLDWLIEKVQFVEIAAYSDDDAYTIFETMNDRGLSLAPSDMLKGFLLSRVRDIEAREIGARTWISATKKLVEFDKDAVENFFRSWFRGKFAQTVGEVSSDYERIGPQYHRWLRDHLGDLGLRHSEDFEYFVNYEMKAMADWYAILRSAAIKLDSRLPSVFYAFAMESNLDLEMMALSVVSQDFNSEENLRRIQLVARYLDIVVARRIWGGFTTNRQSLKNSFVPLVRQLRTLPTDQLAGRLYAELTKVGVDNFSSLAPVLTRSIRTRIHRFLARITDYVETQGGAGASLFDDYSRSTGRSRFDIEHIWPDNYEAFKSEMSEAEFGNIRNQLGGLILLPQSFNRSYQDMAVATKIPLYGRPDHNLLAASLSESIYKNNPRFAAWINATQFPFVAYEGVDRPFNRGAIEDRTELYRQLAKAIWSPEHLISDSGIESSAIHEQADRVRQSLASDPASRSRNDSNVSVQDLIQSGLISPSDILRGPEIDGVQPIAMILANGQIEIDGGEVFDSLSRAAMSVQNTDSPINGWTFWVHESMGKKMIEIREAFLVRNSQVSG
jgi:hypothetical protein